MSEEILDLETRKKIYTLLIRNPGLNLSTIASQLQMSVTLADYHLNFLEEHELIVVEKEGGYKRYYIKGKVSGEEKKILSLLQQDLPLNIILLLLKTPGLRPKDLKDSLGISPALLTYYLKKLVKYNIINELVSEVKNQYVVSNQHLIMKLLISYKSNVLLTRFNQTWSFDIPLSSKVAEEKKVEEKKP
jgi:predicted transcriptional regulator